MPREFFLMIFLAVFPPVFFMVMNPRVKSANDARNGKVNLDQWNNEMPMTENDKKRKFKSDVFLFFNILVVTGLVLVA